MLENAVYSVISPEGCAAILWQDAAAAADAAAARCGSPRPTCCRLGVVDGVVPEPAGGAHADPVATAAAHGAAAVCATLLPCSTSADAAPAAGATLRAVRRPRRSGRHCRSGTRSTRGPERHPMSPRDRCDGDRGAGPDARLERTQRPATELGRRRRAGSAARHRAAGAADAIVVDGPPAVRRPARRDGPAGRRGVARAAARRGDAAAGASRRTRVLVAAPMVGTFYRAPEPGRDAVRRGRRPGRAGPAGRDRRGDEADEPGRGRPGRPGRGDPRRRRRAGRVRAAAARPRPGSTTWAGRAMFKQGADRQPGRDRPAGAPGLPGMGIAYGGGLLHGGPRLAPRCASPTRRSRSGRRRPAQLPQRRRRSSRRPCRPGPRPSTPATGSSPRTPDFAEICEPTG